MTLQEKIYGSHKKMAQYAKKLGAYSHATRTLGNYQNAPAELLGIYNGSVAGGKSHIMTEMAKK